MVGLGDILEAGLLSHILASPGSEALRCAGLGTNAN